MSEQGKCPDCGELLIRPAKYADPAFFEPISHHTQAGLECLKRQNSQLREKNERLVLIVTRCGSPGGIAFEPIGPTHTPDERAATDAVRFGLRQAQRYVREAKQPEGEQP